MPARKAARFLVLFSWMVVFCLLGTEKESGPITSDSGALSGIAFAGSGKNLENAASAIYPERKKMVPKSTNPRKKHEAVKSDRGFATAKITFDGSLIFVCFWIKPKARRKKIFLPTSQCCRPKKQYSSKSIRECNVI